MKNLLKTAVLGAVAVVMTGCAATTFHSPTQTAGKTPATGAAKTSASINPYANVYITSIRKSSGDNRYVYPQVNGLPSNTVQSQLNATFKRFGYVVPDKQHTVQTGYQVIMQRGSFLEIMMLSYIMETGAAHGMPSQTPLLINLQSGDVYQIGDLFQDGTNYLKRISDVVKAEDKTHELDAFGPFTGVTAKDGFYLTDRGVVVFFSPYEWTAYALGFPQFTVPYSALMPLINQHSALWKIFKSPQALASAHIEQQDLAVIRAKGYTIQTTPETTATFAQTVGGQGQSLYVWAAYSDKAPDQSAQKLFFFLGNRYLGTDTWRDHAAVYDVIPNGRATIQATYARSNGPDFTISYHWNGTKMVLTPNFPASYKDWSSK